MIVKICMVLIFVGVAVGVGIYCRRTTRSVDGFVLGGRNVGPWMSAFAFGTSYFSAVVFVGYAGQFGWKYGIAALWAGIGNAILGSLLAWWVLGPRTREMTHRLGATTMPEFFGSRYRSKGLRIAAAAIIFVFLIPYTASVYNGLSRLFGMAFGLPYEVCVIGMAAVTCIYVVVGGYMATVMNDFLQGIVMLLGIVAVIVAVLANNGGFTEAINQLSTIPSELSPMDGAFVSMFGPDPLNLLGVVILTSLGTWGLPQMVQKFYAIKSGPAVKQGAIISTLFAFVVAGGSYFLGGFGRLYADQVEMGRERAASVRLHRSHHAVHAAGRAYRGGDRAGAVRFHVHAVVAGAHVFQHAHARPDQGQRGQEHGREAAAGLHARAAGGVRGGVGRAGTGAVPLVHHVHRAAHGHHVGRAGRCVSGPVSVGAVLRRISRAAVWASFIVGVGLTTGNMIAGLVGTPFIASPINCGAIAMVLSLVIVPVVSLFTKCVPFEVDPPHGEGAIDREYEQELEAE